MDGALLHVVTFTPHTHEDVHRALRCLRHAAGRGEQSGHTLLLFCDLPDAQVQHLPQDMPILRCLQSGVMAMNERTPGRFALLARRRQWDDAARLYLGHAQRMSVRRVIAQLLERGSTQAVFDAATISPGKLQEQYAAVLFSDLSLACTPDTPTRMLRTLEAAHGGCLCARVLPRREFPQTTLARLWEAGFSLSPLRAAHDALLLRRGLCRTDRPILFSADALIREPDVPHAPIAQDCFFVRRESVTLPQLFAAQRRHCLRGSRDALPLLQTALLLAAARLGLPWLAAASMLLPELPALLSPRRLPSALVRTALLPLTAAVSLDALLCRLFARSAFIRIRLPGFCFTAWGGALMGGLLAALGFGGSQALAAVLPAALLWLAAPLLLPALSSPTIERTPLSGDQLSQLRAMAQDVFFEAYENERPAPRAMLAACAGCMLGLLEPDEAARHVQLLLESGMGIGTPDAADHAALLCCAQFVREHMGQCDAALRDLPARVEALALSLPSPECTSKLGAYLLSAYRQDASHAALAALSLAEDGQPMDTLFLPIGPARQMAQHTLSLPLTHPHTYLRRADSRLETEGSPLDRFLILAAAALSHPFCALLRRSPVAAPYAPLLDAAIV